MGGCNPRLDGQYWVEVAESHAKRVECRTVRLFEVQSLRPAETCRSNLAEDKTITAPQRRGLEAFDLPSWQPVSPEARQHQPEARPPRNARCKGVSNEGRDQQAT
eukprot:6193539-Pleurochrysis_carterae.AAC.2